MSASTQELVRFTRVRSTNRAIVWSTLRRVMRGAILTAVFAGFMMAIQGFAIAKTYTTTASREQFAATITSVPGLGLVYGEPIKVDTPAGYMVYRVLPIATFVAAMWGLFTVTRLLRGDEEDGRWEMLLSGQTTAGQAAVMTLLGCGLGLVVLYAVTSAMMLLIGGSSDINLPTSTSLLISLAITGLAAIFMGVGAFTSQLAATRRRALTYGLVPLISFFLIRSVGNVVSDVSWLKNFTPFGWVDRLQLMVDARHLGWFLPMGVLAVLCGFAGVYFARRRDLGDSVIPESGTARPHYGFLNGVELFSLRLMRVSLVSWLISCIGIVSVIAALAKAARSAVSASSSLTQELSSLSGGSHSFDLAFIGFGTFFLGILLMAMATTALNAAWGQEAKGYLDNIVIHPVSRARWLVGRLVILYISCAVICLVSGAAVWGITGAASIQVDGGTMVFGSLSLLGPVALLLGVGTLLYGYKPRLAIPVMWGLIIYAFTIDLVGSAVKLNDVIVNSSLFHYVTLVPATSPDWKTFGIISTIGVLLVAAGIVLFSRRDLEAE